MIKIENRRNKVRIILCAFIVIMVLIAVIIAIFSKNKLKYELNEDGQGYTVYAVNSKSTEIVIPDTYKGLPVTGIGDEAFAFCMSLNSITIPDSVTNIGDSAFKRCVSLKSIVIPNSVTKIGNGVFSGCDSLASVTFSESVTSISDRTFEYCGALVNFTIPKSVTSIGDYAFFYCESLTNIIIPDSVTSIGDAFNYCTSLASIVVSKSLSNVGKGAFSNCSSLKDVYYNGEIEDWLTIPFDWRSNPLCNGANLYFNNNLVTEIIIPDNITHLGSYALDGCISLKSITLSDSFGDVSFLSNCYSLKNILVDENNKYYKSIDGNLYSKDGTKFEKYARGKENTSFTLPDSVTTIEGGAFYNCVFLREITIPDSVIKIVENPFMSCTSLNSIYFEGTRELWRKITRGTRFSEECTIYCSDGQIRYN